MLTTSVLYKNIWMYPVQGGLLKKMNIIYHQRNSGDMPSVQ